MPKKLFYKDQYLKSFRSEVTACTAIKDFFAISLAETAFYPEGGGQHGDSGKIGDAEIYDTHERDGEIFHYSKTPLEVGTVVDCAIDWDRRFSLMQEHSGEHIVSGIIHQKFGYHNVGFHMGAETVTIDFDGVIDAQQLGDIERLANEKIWENSETEINIYRANELKSIAYRSKKELEGDVRIVTFQGSDCCACCGLHVAHTGEIGCIRLLSVQNLRGGVRIEMNSGRKCYEYFADVAEQNASIAKKLSVKERTTDIAVQRLKDETQALKIQIAELNAMRFVTVAEGYRDSENVLHFEHNITFDELCKLTNQIMEQISGTAAVFTGDDASGYKYAVGKKDSDIRTEIKAMNTALGGRGGGKPHFAQGSVSAKREDIETYFTKM